MSAPQGKKRGPTVLVTDAREVPRAPQRPSNMMTRQNTRIISVDNVLQYASEIPSAQRRVTPGARPLVHHRTPSGRHPLDPKLTGRGLPITTAHIPSRTSKVSEKLVLLPDAGSPPDDGSVLGEDDEAAPPNDEEIARRRKGRYGDKSYAERLPKARRAETLARVTAYCTAQSFKLRSTAEFIRDQHGAKTKLYDDCLYCVYQLPLLGGSDGYRIRSSPVLKNPGGKSVLDEQIEMNERRTYREGWHEDHDEFSVIGNEGQLSPEQNRRRDQTEEGGQFDDMDERRLSTASSLEGYPSPRTPIAADATSVAELYIFSYGVAVFWNFTEHQEKDILADLTFSSSSSVQAAKFDSLRKSPYTGLTKLPLLTKPLTEADFETEEFHFEYNREIERPRIFNDMITLRTSDHMIKLAMSHAIAQSTKLSFFEERMARTMSEAQYVPRKLALEGRLGMSRTEVVTLVGKLFEGRVDVNLSSNMLDTPNFFWDSEPTLHPLYQAVREYLEIKPRIQVLNERCRVFLDLAEILSDSIADTKMTRITWIIIVLIIISILVTCSEVFLRFGILASGKKEKPDVAAALAFMTPSEL
ncbi:Sad1-interacting factor 3 [Elsinoe australis]|uniref:Sad1-interacting factor 3 n=1 Tax=Elsinoe australis TaxID=40998 RepID=A0A2P7ZUH1_9PEZI|nr:Sad1-interacting factor 3 [Elsinoe australis]